MPEKRPLCLYAGRIEELRAADTVPAGPPPGSVHLLPANTSDAAWQPMDGRYLAVASYPALTSLPAPVLGEHWEQRVSGTTQSLTGVTWSGTQFCVVGGGGTIRTSPDGITWTSRTSGTTQSLLAATWSGTQFCVVGGGGTILTSPDGITWTSRTSGTTQGLNAATHAENRFWAVGVVGALISSPAPVAGQHVLPYTPPFTGTHRQFMRVA